MRCNLKHWNLFYLCLLGVRLFLLRVRAEISREAIGSGDRRVSLLLVRFLEPRRAIYRKQEAASQLMQQSLFACAIGLIVR